MLILVKDWRETLKFFDMDFLKSMVDYDPTKIQKKARVKRTKKAVKCKLVSPSVRLRVINLLAAF